MLTFLARQDGLQRLHVALNLRSDFVLGNSQVVARLEIHPERQAVLEIACETQRAVSAVIPRRSLTMSAIRVTGTRKSTAILFMLSPSGSMNSSLRISPGCTGFHLLAMLRS